MPPLIFMRRLALAALLVLLACREHKPPSVVLISIDTLRSDHLPAYGYRAIATPHLDALVRDGIVYEHAYANVPLTLPSHTTIMTGLLPPEHGVRDNAGFRLDPSKPTIASTLHARGYATGAAVSAYVLRRDTNLSSGFDFYDDAIEFVEGAPSGNLQRSGEITVSIIEKWIDTHRQQPFFAFVHLYEPHAPYEPSYDGEIVKADRATGRLLDFLRARKLYDDAMIVVVSDHGEGLGDHGEQEHGVLLYREALQVPLIVKMPRGERAGTRVAEPAQLADLFSIIIKASVPQHGALYAETLYPRIHLGWSELRSVIRFPLHLISGPKPELYDLTADPHEARDLRSSRRREAAHLDGDLAAFPQTAAATPRVSAEERKKLAALGYVDAGAGSAASNANPRDHLRDLEALKDVTALMAQRDYANAAQRIEELLQRNPGWSDLRNDLGLAYEQLGDLARAEAVYRDGIRATPELAHAFALPLATVLAREGKLDEAAQHARLALPDAGAHELLARIAFIRRNYDEALREVQSARGASANVLTAEIFAAQGRREDALVRLQNVKPPYPARYWYITGDVLAGLGRTGEARAAFEREIAAQPHDRDAYVALAFASAAEGDRAAALATLERMTRAVPGSAAEAEDIRRNVFTRSLQR